MTRAAADLPPPPSARPAVTAELIARTGLDEVLLTELVHRLYDRVRADAVLGRIFAARIGRSLVLFRETAHETCPPEGAAHVIERAEHIARSLHIAVGEAQAPPDAFLHCTDERTSR